MRLWKNESSILDTLPLEISIDSFKDYEEENNLNHILTTLQGWVDKNWS